MTLIKMFGKMLRYFILLLIFLFISCGSNKNKLFENNYFNENYFYNDNLKVGIDFDKDIQFRDFSVINEKMLKHLLKDHINISPKDVFLIADSKEQGIELYLFYQRTQTFNSNLVSSKKVFTDTVNNLLLFEKQKGNRKVLGLVKSNSNKINNYSAFVSDLLNKINIDSLNTRKISFPSIFINNFPTVHPNPLYASKKLLSAPLKSEEGDDTKFQLLSTVNSFMSNNNLYDSLIVGYEKERKEGFNSIVVGLSQKDDVYKDNEVFFKIGEIAKENKVIILNEDHYYPKHRLFAMEALEILKAKEYKYVSIEGFNVNTEKELTPNYHNGLYTSEPYFAHFIRKAIALGFDVLGHENVNKGIDRELGQAKNIMKILEKDPDAKIFVYVGHDHLEKKNQKKKWMAEYFEELSSINPVTINQVVICADTKEDLTLIPRKYFTDTTKIKSSADFFLVNNLKPSLKVIYPNVLFKKTFIEDAKFSGFKNKKLLVEVVDFKEFDSVKNLAIPIQSYLMIPKDMKINLELPIGKYHIFVKTDDNKTLYDDDISIN